MEKVYSIEDSLLANCFRAQRRFGVQLTRKEGAAKRLKTWLPHIHICDEDNGLRKASNRSFGHGVALYSSQESKCIGKNRGEMGDCVNIHDNISSALDIKSLVPSTPWHFSTSEHQLNIFLYLQYFLKIQYTTNWKSHSLCIFSGVTEFSKSCHLHSLLASTPPWPTNSSALPHLDLVFVPRRRLLLTVQSSSRFSRALSRQDWSIEPSPAPTPTSLNLGRKLPLNSIPKCSQKSPLATRAHFSTDLSAISSSASLHSPSQTPTVLSLPLTGPGTPSLLTLKRDSYSCSGNLLRMRMSSSMHG